MSLAYVPASGREPRFWKYVFLISTSVLIVWLIFFAYANYAFRREIDDKIRQVAPDETIETIIYKIDNSRQTMDDIKQLRCAQREMIAYYRWASMPHRANLSRLYDVTQDSRDTIGRFLSERSEVDKVRLPDLLRATWGLVRFDEIPLKASLSSEQVSTFRNSFDTMLKEVVDRAHERAVKILGAPEQSADISNFEKFGSDLKTLDKRIFDTTGIDAIEAKLGSLDKVLKRDETSFESYERLAIMKLMAESAFSGAPDKAVDQVRIKIGDPTASEGALAALDCAHNDRNTINYISDRLQAIVGSYLKKYPENSTKENSVAERELNKFVDFIRTKHVWSHNTKSDQAAGLLQRPMFAFLALPTSMQALAVTILFGMLGGQTVNLLRLSRVGYWGTQPEPEWSDIAAVPILGGIAALAIYLLTAMGIVVGTEGRSGVGQLNTIGAALVGFLAFVSGLLNQEAFARVQAVGQRLLSAQPQAVGIALTKVDQDLSEQLEALDCRLMADLVRRHGLGTYLDDPARKDHALLVPADAWFEGRTAKDWFDLAAVSGRKRVLALVDQLLLKEPVVPPNLQDGEDLATATGKRYAVSVTMDDGRTVAKIAQSRLETFTPIRWRGLDLIPVDGPPDPGAV